MTRAPRRLFEDRVLKASTLQIGSDCDVGAFSVVLYESCLEDNVRLGAVFLVKKGETLPAGTAWIGTPATWSEGVSQPQVAKRAQRASASLRRQRARRPYARRNPAGVLTWNAI